MSEFGVNNTGKPSEVGQSAYWAQNGASDWSDAANVSVPSAARRGTGVINGEGAVSAWYNWKFSVIFRILDWLSARFIRTFDDFTEAASTVDDGHCFMVSQDSPRVAPWTRIDDDSPEAVACEGICTDGPWLYVLDNGTIHQCNPTNTPASVNSVTEPNTSDTFNSMTCDGRFLYLSYDNGSSSEVYILNLDLTTYFPGIAVGSDTIKCVGNGETFAFYTSTNLCFTYDLSPFALNGSVNHGAQINDIAVDHGLVCIVGNAGTGGAHVRTQNLLTGALVDTFILPSTSGTPVAFSVCADGEFFYVLTSAITDTAGGNYNMIVLNRELEEVARFSAGHSDATRCACDERYVYAVDVNNDFLAIDKTTGRASRADHTGDIFDGHVDCNGESAFCLSTTGEIVRYRRGVLSDMIYRKEDATDPVRSPMWKLANPVNKR